MLNIVKRFKFLIAILNVESNHLIEGCLLKEEQFKVLKTLSEATSRMDINMFAKKVNLDPNQTIQQVQDLAKEGFLQKVGSGFGITAKGKAALKAFIPLPEGMGFHFYNGIDQPTGITAKTLGEFYEDIKQVSADSLEFHIYRGDFENWLKDACSESEFATEVGIVKDADLKGEELRAELLKVLDAKYGIQELL
jgi:predicted transcriptional regulator